MEHGSLGDDVSAECWYCGSTHSLHAVKLSNNQDVKLCTQHIKPFAKEAYKARQRKHEWVLFLARAEEVG
jgi:hypothetical protein